MFHVHETVAHMSCTEALKSAPGVCIYIYIYIYVCMYVCIYTHKYIHAQNHTHTHTQALDTCIHIYKVGMCTLLPSPYQCWSLSLSLSLFLCTPRHVSEHLCIHTYIHTHTYTTLAQYINVYTQPPYKHANQARMHTYMYNIHAYNAPMYRPVLPSPQPRWSLHRMQCPPPCEMVACVHMHASMCINVCVCVYIYTQTHIRPCECMHVYIPTVLVRVLCDTCHDSAAPSRPIPAVHMLWTRFLIYART